jgi:iron-sulfur cluster assembly protein
LFFEAAEVVFVAAAVVAFAVSFDAVAALSALVGSGFLAGAVLAAGFVATLTGALAGAFAGALGAVFAGALAGALAAGFTGALVAGFVVGFAAGLETFLTGAFVAGFAAGLAAGFFAGALAAGLETFFAGDFEAAGLGLAAAALFFDADAFGFEALAFGLAAGFLAADFLDDGLDEGMGDGRWKRGMWIYHSYSMGAAEFPLARRTKRERFGCVKGFLKNKFLVLQTESLSLAQEFIFGFEFPCGWLTLPGEMITLTESAAAELKRLLAAKGETEGAGLCLAVRKGGCAGWQYEMRVGQPSEGDVLVEDHGARVIVAADSVERLRGCEVDFSDDLTDSGFKVNNPRAARSCGCGTSFESLEEPAAGPDETGTEDCRA